MRFAEMPSAHYDVIEEVRRKLFKELRLEETAIEILKRLSKTDCANVYEISKSLPNAGHYSTILRALRRLKEKRLVRNAFEGIETTRGQIFYETTSLGELIAALSKGSKEGWVAAANVLARKSTRFIECMKAHRPLYPFYYWTFTRQMIEELRRFPKYRDVEPDLERLAETVEREWIAENIMTLSYAPENRPGILEDLKILSHVGWIRSIVIGLIDEHVREEGEWLKAIVDFKSRLVASEKEVKLTKFLIETRPLSEPTSAKKRLRVRNDTHGFQE